MKNKVAILFSIPMITVIIFAVKTYSFQNRLDKFFRNTSLSIELIEYGWWSNENYYLFNRNTAISSQLKEMLEWDDAPYSFKRGGEYPYINFKITAPDGKEIFFTISIHRLNNVVKLVFSDIKNQIEYIKAIEDPDILNEFLRHFYTEEAAAKQKPGIARKPATSTTVKTA
jgi:hypothetical protein